MSEVIQFDNLAQHGVLKDIPDLTLPQNSFSEAVNVRFRNNAIHKLEGEVDLGEFGNGTNEIIFITYWANPNLTPNDGYYVYVHTDGTHDYVCLRSVSGSVVNSLYSVNSGGVWQSTVFQGGHILILNNGKDVPKYIADKDGNTDAQDIQAFDLVGWNDDYTTLEEIINITYNSDTTNRDFSLGKEVNFNLTKVIAYILDEAGDIVDRSELTGLGTEGEFTISLDVDTNTHILTASASLDNNFNLVVYLQSVDKVILTAGVIRAFGNLLIAGNLRETSVSTGETIRRLTGAVRTSDVAQPGSVPTNWNPFAVGVSTADEFILSATGIVQDIVELQGRAYVYTNHSIHSLTPTGNASVPFSLDVVSSAYGVHSMDMVVEVDGKHIVVGANDIYVFSGHPGNIQSIADDRVRYFFYDRLHSEYAANSRVVRYQRYNELWFCYPSTESVSGELNEVLIWNYRSNIWSRRILSPFWGITTGLAKINSTVDVNQYHPIIATETDIVAGDSGYQDKNGNTYESYVERTNIEIRPVFDTESLKAFGMYLQSDESVRMELQINQKNNPSDPTDFSNDKTYFFFSNTVDGEGNSISDYKADIRVNGRFMGYRVSDGLWNDKNWVLSSVAVEVAKSGRR